MSLDEIIDLLIEVRIDLKMLRRHIDDKDIKEYLKHAIQGINIVGCELSQNIRKKLEIN